MRSVHFRLLGLALAALIALPALAMAQAASPILNALEVRKLIASTDPADNERMGSIGARSAV